MRRQTRTWEPGAWSGRSERPRVLVEDPDGAVRSTSEQYLRREGFDVAVCPGPDGMGSRRCPEVIRATCALVDGADVVYSNLGWNSQESRDVLAAHRRHHPETPVVAEVCQPTEQRLGDLLADCRVVHVPVGRSAMLNAIKETLAASSSS